MRGSPNEAPPPLAQTWANAMPIVDLGAGVFGGYGPCRCFRGPRGCRGVEVADMTARDTDWTERWREVAGQHWVTVAERRGAMAGRFGASMLDAADRKAGERVLDVGCEHGATRVEAARRGRRGGVAVGIDLSAEMLGLARQRAAAVGSNAVWFASGDVESRVRT